MTGLIGVITLAPWAAEQSSLGNGIWSGPKKKWLEQIIQKPPAQKKLHSTMQHKKPAAPCKDHHLRGLDLLDVEVASEIFWVMGTVFFFFFSFFTSPLGGSSMTNTNGFVQDHCPSL